MAAFRFNLERVLEQRLREEREKQKAVAVIERERAALEDALRRTQQAIAGQKQDLREALYGANGGRRAIENGVGEHAKPRRLNITSVRLQASASLGAVAEAQRTALRLAGVYKRLASARAELLAAATRRKAVETLKSRRYEAWKKEEARRERAAEDDLAGQRAAAAMVEGQAGVHGGVRG